jgi:hypothetical protein
MAHGAPDWVRTILISVLVNNQAITPSSVVELPAGGAGYYSGVDITYQAVKVWTVTAGTTGELTEISIMSNNTVKAMWRVLINGVAYLNNQLIGAPLTLPFDCLKLAAGSVVEVDVESTDGTAILAWASIVAKEVLG